MSSLSQTTSILAHSMAWALIHSIGQGLLIFALLFVLLKVLPGTSSRIKYYFSFLAFAALFVWFGETWVSQFERLKAMVVVSSGSMDVAPMPIIMSDLKLVNVPMVAVSAPSLSSQLLHIVEQNVPSIMTIYMAGLVFMLFRFAINLYSLKALNKQGISEPDSRWSELINEWGRRFAISRPVKLFLSSKINVPMMLGTLKPVILLPIATINNLTTEQVEAILLHELAHIKRYDFLLNMLQTAGETILFFNPFIWLISSVIRRQRENCCDDLVVANTDNPLQYAQALAILEHCRIDQQQLALAATGNKNQLLNRIKRIMELKNNRPGYGQFSIIMVAFIALAFIVSMCIFSTSMAKKTKTAKGDTTSINSAFGNKSVIDENNKADENLPATFSNNQSNSDNNLNVIEEDTATTAQKNSNHGFLEDTLIIRFRMNKGTNVWARLADNPLAGKGIIKSLNYGNTGEAINWDELKIHLHQLISNAYQHINGTQLSEVIDKEINKAIEQHKMFRERLVSIIDSIYVTFEMKDGTKYYVNLFSNPLINPKIFKGVRSNGNDSPTDWDELRTNFEQVVTEAYKNINSPGLQHEIETAINKEIEEGKIREENRKKRNSSQANLIQELTKDGMIDTGMYFIYYVHDTFYINNVMQPQNVYDRYSKYFDKSCSFSITNRQPSAKVKYIK